MSKDEPKRRLIQTIQTELTDVINTLGYTNREMIETVNRLIFIRDNLLKGLKDLID